jgi:hypothetical protein
MGEVGVIDEVWEDEIAEDEICEHALKWYDKLESKKGSRKGKVVTTPQKLVEYCVICETELKDYNPEDYPLFFCGHYCKIYFTKHGIPCYYDSD